MILEAYLESFKRSEIALFFERSPKNGNGFSTGIVHLIRRLRGARLRVKT